jgi:hypothetical protein
VGVHEFVDVIVAEQLTDAERATAVAGLNAIDARAVADAQAPFAQLSAAARGKIIESLESESRDAEPARTYWRLKGLIVHGYFTSERVMKDVLKHKVMPGNFEGSVPVTISGRVKHG